MKKSDKPPRRDWYEIGKYITLGILGAGAVTAMIIGGRADINHQITGIERGVAFQEQTTRLSDLEKGLLAGTMLHEDLEFDIQSVIPEAIANSSVSGIGTSSVYIIRLDDGRYIYSSTSKDFYSPKIAPLESVSDIFDRFINYSCKLDILVNEAIADHDTLEILSYSGKEGRILLGLSYNGETIIDPALSSDIRYLESSAQDAENRIKILRGERTRNNPFFK